MAGLGKSFLTLAMASGIWLGVQGTALAATCSDMLDIGWPGKIVSNPPTEDRQAIMDLIHTYYWTLDDKDTSGVDSFDELMTNDFTYVACRAGGQVELVAIKDRATLINRTKETFAKLNQSGLRTRHFVSNDILNVTKDGLVEGKFILLVTIQRAASADVPDLDYTASVKVRFKKDGDRWKFIALTLITDTPDVEERAR